MHVLCYGAGAIGSLVGGRLAFAGMSVTLLARVEHVASVRTWGLILETPHGRLTCKQADSITSLDDLAHTPDLVALTVRAYQTQEALEAMRGLLKQGVPVLSLQNGVGNEEAIATVAGAEHTYAGAITINAAVLRPGVVRQTTAGGGIGLASLSTGQDLTALVALFRGAGFRVTPYREYRSMKWSKLLLNIIGNAQSAILDLSPAAIARDPRCFGLEQEAFREACRVMKGLGLRSVPLPGYPVPLLQVLMGAPPWIARLLLERRIGGGRGEKMPTLWENLQRGRARSEVEVLNGAVARAGKQLGIPTPVNTVLTEVLLDLASGRRVRSEFYRKPEALLSLLEAARIGA